MYFLILRVGENMKIALLQMNMKLGKPSENFIIAEEMINKAMKDKPDVLVLPETWNTGFFPKENFCEQCCLDGENVKLEIGSLAKKYSVNIVAGSVSNIRDNKVYNTSFIFNREGKCVAEYDKTHLFTPMGEDNFYTPGDHICHFELDGVKCGVIICYDLRFPELARKLALEGIDVLFVVSQWPKVRINHLRILTTARAIENQIFIACSNSCGSANGTEYGGFSAIVDPFGETLVLAGGKEEIISAECDIKILSQIRESIPVFMDRHPELY